MTTLIDHDRLAKAKRAFSTRNVAAASLGAVSAGVAPRAGDVVLARVLEIGAHENLELPTSRKAKLFVGDEVILAYGNRYAPDQFEAYVPDDLGPCDLAAGGGIAARVTFKNQRIAEPTRIEPIGLFVEDDLSVVNVRDHALRKGAPAFKVPGICVAGGSMNAGKTTTAAAVIRGLAQAGYKVGAAKLTGTGAGNDYWHMRDAGAIRVLDFTDAGLATTYRASHLDLEICANTLSAHLVDSGAEVLVFEIADGLFQEETAWLIESAVLSNLVDGYFYAGESAASAALGVQWLRTHGRVLGLSGLISRSPLASREAERATGIPCFTREMLATADTARGFLAQIGKDDTRQAA